MDYETQGLRNIVEMQMEANAQRAAELEAKHRYLAGGPLPPSSRWKRTRLNLRWKVNGARQALAEWISPYGLDD